jgi:hypothetical protein
VEVVHTPGRTGDFAGAPVSGQRAREELGWHAVTPFREGIRRYLASQPVPAARAESWRSRAQPVAGRAALARAWAALSAAMVLGVVTLVPVDRAIDRYDTFSVALLLLLPLVLAGGFEWEAQRARALRAALWTAAIACVVVVATPWGPVDRIGDSHPIVLMMFAASAAGASLLSDSRAPLRALLTTAGE